MAIIPLTIESRHRPLGVDAIPQVDAGTSRYFFGISDIALRPEFLRASRHRIPDRTSSDPTDTRLY